MPIVATSGTTRFSPDNRTLTVRQAHRVAKVWDTGTGCEIGLLQGHLSTLAVVAFSADVQMLATTSMDGFTRLWDARTLKFTSKFRGQLSSPWGAAFSPEGDRLVVMSGEGLLKVYDVASQQELITIKEPSPAGNFVSFIDSNTIVTAADATVLLYRGPTFQTLDRVQQPSH